MKLTTRITTLGTSAAVLAMAGLLAGALYAVSTPPDLSSTSLTPAAKVLPAQFGGGFGGGGSPQPQPPPDQGGGMGGGGGGGSDYPGNRPAPNNPPPQRPSDPPQQQGALEQIIQRSVGEQGEFKLVRAVRDQNTISQGAVDCLVMQYQGSDGTPLEHIIILLRNDQAARQGGENVAASFRSGGLQLQGEADLKDRNQAVIGHIWLFYNSQTQSEACLWTNGPLVCLAVSKPEYAVWFMKKLPY